VLGYLHTEGISDVNANIYVHNTCIHYRNIDINAQFGPIMSLRVDYGGLHAYYVQTVPDYGQILTLYIWSHNNVISRRVRVVGCTCILCAYNSGLSDLVTTKPPQVDHDDDDEGCWTADRGGYYTKS
jgi:hypothetical protein